MRDTRNRRTQGIGARTAGWLTALRATLPVGLGLACAACAWSADGILTTAAAAPGSRGVGAGQTAVAPPAATASSPALAPPAAAPIPVTATAPQACPCTIFQPADAPAGPAFTDNRPVELGVKFRASVDGFVTGVRFYKAVLNAGSHVGHLWSAGGTQLAEAPFTSETASGWQEVAFSTPIPIAANATYIASYHSPSYYSATAAFFTSATVNGPLRGLADGEDGPNGVFSYGEAGFPTGAFQQMNYWVDVVFNTVAPPDDTPPQVAASSLPGNGASGVPITSAVTAIFNEAIDPATITTGTFELHDDAQALVPSSVSYSTSMRTASLVPGAPLAYSTGFTATLRGGTTDPRVEDLAGNALSSSVTWSFTTAAPPAPAPSEGPGGPILVISAASNPFSRYVVEILRAEGLNEFRAMDVSGVDATVLNDYDVVILGEMPLSAAQVTMLGNWTDAGGLLIALRPDAQLAGLLGLTPGGGTLSNAYLRVNTATGPGVGIVDQTMQFHGAADRYTLNGATSVATLYADASTATGNPAVTQRNVGTSGGQAVAFTYDLARSVVYTRQGNPAWAGQERDGISPRRATDLFYGDAAGDPQPDWVDPGKAAIPQADEQQRLLANVIVAGALHRKPLPRFWYLPKGLKAAVVMTGDDHGDAGMQPRFDIYRTQSPAGCSVDDWECVRASGYEYVGTGFTDAQAQFYNSLGFEVALHVNTNCNDWTPSSLAADVAAQLAAFGSALPGIPPPVTNRTHCVAWSDWSTEAEVESAHGIRLDTNYYYWPASWVQGRPGLFTGSGMPMRFAKLDGTIIDCYQVATQLVDESGLSYPTAIDSLLERALGPRGYYGVFCANMHFDDPNHASSDAVVASAQARGVPVVSAKQMLAWLDGRNGSSFGGLSWSANALSFSIAVGAGSRNLRAMLPTRSAGGTLAGLTRNGVSVSYTVQSIKGIDYALFPADAGVYVATYPADTTPPMITAVGATPHPDGTATVAWTTDEPSGSRVDYGTSSGALAQQAADTARVTSHSVTLAGLSPSTTYYYRVTSSDASSNAATEPPVASGPMSFLSLTLACFLDQTDADFGLGSGTGTYVSCTGDGEVTLAPAVGAEFGGGALPGDWTSLLWSDGSAGGATVSAGGVVEDGGRLTPVSTTGYGPGRVLEFVATFGVTAFEHLGFGGGDNSLGSSGMFGDPGLPWAIFSTRSSAGPNLYARLNPGADVSVGAGYLGTPHRYRIEWRADSVVFMVDGASMDRRAAAIATPMRVGVSEYTAGGPGLQLDWIRMSPYSSSGTFVSRVHDAGVATPWSSMSWSAEAPAGTSVALAYRIGDTPVPDGGWTSFVPVGVSGGAMGVTARYLQYRAQLATADPEVTPALKDVTFACCADGTSPAAIAGLSASDQAVDTNGDGTRRIQVTFTAPSDAVAVEVYRARFGNYPGYDDAPNAGSVPAAPSYPPDPGRWTLTGVTGSGETDEVGQRDEYYYVAFVKDGCGNMSGVSNRAGGTLNYLLGDVHDGQPGHECTGNNVVFTEDVSYLGSTYGVTLGPGDARRCLDVGPTVTGATNARPTTDGVLDFEDFIVLSLNFGATPAAVVAPRARPAVRQQAEVEDAVWVEGPSAVVAGEVFTVRVRMSGSGAVHGISAQLEWDATVAEVEGVGAGELAQNENGVVLSARAGNVDAVRLGGGFSGTGVLAEVRFRARAAGAPGVRLARVIGRDGANRDVALGQPLSVVGGAVPAQTGLGFAAPNPFRTRLGVELAVSHAQPIRLRVYDLAGRVVTTLVDGREAPGRRVVVWDGRDGQGRAMAAGVYLLKLEAGERRQTRRVLLVR